MEKRPPCWPLDELIEKKSIIDMTGNRQVCGILKGYDQVGNAVLGDCEETKPLLLTDDFVPRKLGTAVIRSTHILAINKYEESQ